MVIPITPRESPKGIIHQPKQALIVEARKYLHVREDAGSNRSIHIDYWNLEAIKLWKNFPIGGKGAPWCASFVTAAGRQALGHAWPVPITASVQTMVDWAKVKGVWYETNPEEGDLFAIFYSNLETPRYGHVGIVVRPEQNSFSTVEGNTNGGGSREGYGVFERLRTHTERFGYIRWVEALD